MLKYLHQILYLIFIVYFSCYYLDSLYSYPPAICIKSFIVKLKVPHYVILPIYTYFVEKVAIAVFKNCQKGCIPIQINWRLEDYK